MWRKERFRHRSTVVHGIQAQASRKVADKIYPITYKLRREMQTGREEGFYSSRQGFFL
jgi:hypothetical protein